MLLTPALVEGRRVRAERPLTEARDAARSAVLSMPEPLRALDAQKRGDRARVAVPRSLWDRRDQLVRAAGAKEIR